MKLQFVVTHWYKILQETEKMWHILNRPAFKHIMFVHKYREKQFFCGNKILTEGVFVTQLSSNAGISFWQIVWVMTNYCFLSGESLHSSCSPTILQKL
jgi:hypothetical protein